MQETMDRMEIEDCLYRYASGIDRHDPELAMTAYHADALDDHGYFVGLAKDFVKRAPKAHAKWAAHQHYILNHRVELSGDTAHGEVYWMMVSRERGNNKVDASGGRYVDRYERREGVWAIAARVCIVEWTRDPDNLAHIFPAYRQGLQDKSDLSYRRPLQVDRPFRNEMPKFQLLNQSPGS